MTTWIAKRCGCNYHSTAEVNEHYCQMFVEAEIQDNFHYMMILVSDFRQIGIFSGYSGYLRHLN